MIVVTDTVERWVEPSEVRDLFEGKVNEYERLQKINREVKAVVETEYDDELGLEIVQKETIESKYGTPPLDPKNDFHNSLKEQFEQRGRLSDKQVYCLKNPRY